MARIKIYHIGEAVLTNLVNGALNGDDRPIDIYTPGKDLEWLTQSLPLIGAISSFVPGRYSPDVAYSEMRLNHTEHQLDPMHRIDCGIIFGGYKLVFPIEAKFGDSVFADAEFRKRYLGAGPTVVLDASRPSRVKGRVPALLENMSFLTAICPDTKQVALTQGWGLCLRESQIEKLKKRKWPFRRATVVFSIESLAKIYSDRFEEAVWNTLPDKGKAFVQLL